VAEVEDLLEAAREALLAVLALPGATVDALGAVAVLPQRLDRLISLVESATSAVETAASGVEVASEGIAGAAATLGEVVEVMGRSLPALVGGAASLVELTERLSDVAGGLAVDLPRLVATVEAVSPDLARVVEVLGERLDHLDAVVTQLGQVVTGALGVIPGMRRAIGRSGSSA
jgi:hypothetical protein